MGRNKASYRNLAQMPKYCKQAADAIAEAEAKSRVEDTFDDMIKKVHGNKTRQKVIS